MDYPKEFKSCPNCGSVERFSELVAQEEIAKGNLSKDTKTAIMFYRTMIFNPNDQKVLLVRKQVPVLMGVFDVCTQCGTLYCVCMDKQVAVVEPQVRSHGGDGSMPPFFGKG